VLLAFNRFVSPVPAAQLWVLATYYAAQGLIVGGWVRGAAAAAERPPRDADTLSSS